MLNPRLLGDAIVAALKTIPALVTAVGSVSRITAYHYLYGVDSKLELAINQMLAPSILVVCRMAQPGNFDGQTIYKYHYEINVRVANAAGQVSPLSYEDYWFLIFNSPVNSGSQNIRYVNLVPGAGLMDTPGLQFNLDEDRMDFACFPCVIPEDGDN